MFETSHGRRRKIEIRQQAARTIITMEKEPLAARVLVDMS
jgi:hypothetical protein